MSTTFTLTGDQILKEVESALKRLHVQSDTQVKVDLTDNSVTLTPIHEIKPGAELDEIIAELDRDFGNTFRALAE